MLSHENPVRSPPGPAQAGTSVLAVRAVLTGDVVWARAAWSEHEPLRVEHHAAARRQGARIDSGPLPRGARSRWFRRALLLSGARSAGDRCGGQCPAGRDRGADRAFPALFGRARGVFGRALRPRRDREDRRRGPGGADGRVEVPCRDHRRGRVRRPRPQVSDLGAAAFPCASREGHCDGAHADQASRLRASGVGRRGTGMMTGRDSGEPDVAGGLARHVPVLVRPAIEHLNIRAGGVYIDGTFGAGGYTRAILAAADCKVLALDRDQSAVALSAGLVDEAGGRLTVAESRFSVLDEAAAGFGMTAVDGVVLDLGVSSMQLDSADRGFSFRLDGPLDMRMEADGPSAADVVATASERTLADIIF